VSEPTGDPGTKGPETGAGDLMSEDLRAVFVISVAAELAGVHPQTLRIYERRGLVGPSRTGGGSRRYSPADIERVRHIGDLTAAGLNLEGVRRVLEFEAQLEQLRIELDRVRAEAAEAIERTHRQYRRDLVPFRQASLVRRDVSGRSR
jgi:MerR family transcriptional regulator/heat shock protein HspR